MPDLRFRLPAVAPGASADPEDLVPAEGLPLGAWLAFSIPELDRSQRRDLIASGSVRIDGERADQASTLAAPGALIEVVDVGIEETALTAQVSESATLHALVREPIWSAGSLPLSGATRGGPDGELDFRVMDRSEGVASLSLERGRAPIESCLDALAAAGMPVVGDRLREGLGLPGGPCLSDRPLDPMRSGRAAGVGDRALRVSEETARALARGHPWILPDAASMPASGFRPGSLVRVCDRSGEPLAWAHIEGTERRSARVWASGPEPLEAAPSVAARVAAALSSRWSIGSGDGPNRCDAYRLIHSEADGLPGIAVDRLGPLLRMLVTSRAAESLREPTLRALLEQMPVTPQGEPWSVLEVLHVPSAGAGRFDRVAWLEGGLDRLRACGLELDAEGYPVWERGLRFHVDPGWHDVRNPRPGFGLFPDQRENRDRLADGARQRGGRWLNLFAHTGAFSVALLAAGADSVCSVDLSRPYLDRIDRNLGLNLEHGVEPDRHRSVKGDGRRFIEELDAADRFAGIILDPPTAAAAGRRFWSVKQDLEPLMRACVGHLGEAGQLLVTQNQRGAPLGLDLLLERCARRHGRAVASLTPAPPSLDHPAQPGFPEGDPFEGWLLELE